MSREIHRWRLLRHGYVNLMAGLLMGIPIGAGWHARAWLGVHVIQITSSLAVVVLGLVWRDLQLPDPKLLRLYRLTLGAIYLGLAVGVFNGSVNFPGPVSQPGVVPPAWHAVVAVPTGLAVIVMLFWSVALTIRGLGESKVES